MEIKAPKKVAIYGGSFDPITKGHLKIVSTLLQNNDIDKVVIIPCGNRPDKYELLSGYTRVSMLNIACKSCLSLEPTVINSSNEACLKIEDRFLLDMHEIEDSINMVPTAYLLKKYRLNYPETIFHFVIGSDLLVGLPKWNLFEEYLRFQPFIVFLRTENRDEDFSMLENYKVENEAISTSQSTNVRKEFKDFWKMTEPQKVMSVLTKISEQVSEWVVPEVASFIVANRLYR